jgi:hypothetical protein
MCTSDLHTRGGSTPAGYEASAGCSRCGPPQEGSCLLISDSYPSISDSYLFIGDSYPFISHSYRFISDSYPFISHSYLFINDSYRFISDSYRFISDSYPFISDSYALRNGPCHQTCRSAASLRPYIRGYCFSPASRSHPPGRPLFLTILSGIFILT